MAIANRQAAFSPESSGSDEMSERQEREMKNQTQTTGAARFILQSRTKLLVGLRVVPVAAMLFGIATMAPEASATSCYKPSNIAVNGGRVSNQTTLDLSADGGVAVSTADGGDGNAAGRRQRRGRQRRGGGRRGQRRNDRPGRHQLREQPR